MRHIRGALLTTLALLLVASCGPASEPDTPARERAPGLPAGSVTIGIHRVAVEVAEGREAQRQGLSNREGLAEGSGMLFPYASPERPQFWMKDMHFDIDIVWIAESRIVGVEHAVPHDPPPPLPLYRPEVPVDHVLEVPAGTARRLGWEVGDAVSIER